MLRAVSPRRVALLLTAAVVGVLPASALAAGGPARAEVGEIAKLPLWTGLQGALAASTPMRVTVALRPAPGLGDFAQAVSTPGNPQYRHYLSVTQFAQRFGAGSTAVDAVTAALRAKGLDVGAADANDLFIPVSGTAGQFDAALNAEEESIVLPSGRHTFANLAAPSLPAGIAPYVSGIVGLDDIALPAPVGLARARAHPGARRVVANAGLARFDAGASYASVNAVTASGRSANALSPRVADGGPQPCAQATNAGISTTASPPGADPLGVGYTADQQAAAYGLSSLYGAGDEGRGQTIALYELQAFQQSDITQFAACYTPALSTAPTPVVNVDGGPPAYTPQIGDGESALDIEVAMAFAPQANIVVYQGANVASAPIDILNAMVNAGKGNTNPVPTVISTSYGTCEAFTGPSIIQSENTLLQQAASQGMSFFSASGDSGAETCSQTGEFTDQNNTVLNPEWNTGLSVEDPSGQPFATAVGGTSMFKVVPGTGGQSSDQADRDGTPAAESVWNDGTNDACACGGANVTGTTPTGTVSAGGGSGGGVSNSWAMPPYQKNAAASLGVIATGTSSGTPCQGAAPGASFCREVPDISADGDGLTGYDVLTDASWGVIGGTSASAPFWAAYTALVNASTPCRGTNVGFVNPALYTIAASSYSQDFNAPTLPSPWWISAGLNLTDNDTISRFQVTDGNGQAADPTHLYPEAAEYNMATGLGSMKGAPLAAALCGSTVPAYTVSLATPTAPAGTVGQAYSLQLSGTDSGNAQLHYTATGLPAGLSISTLGLISGTPTAAGTSSVTVTAEDQYRNSAAVTFRITVNAPAPQKPSGNVAASGLTGGRPRFTVTAAHGANAPALHRITITLPSGFVYARSFAARDKGIVVTSEPRSRVTVGAAGRTLTLTFATAITTATVTVKPPLVVETKALKRRLHSRRPGTLVVTLKLTDTAGAVSAGAFRLST